MLVYTMASRNVHIECIEALVNLKVAIIEFSTRTFNFADFSLCLLVSKIKTPNPRSKHTDKIQPAASLTITPKHGRPPKNTWKQFI